MNLESQINTELWVTIEKNYNNESYSSAILDAMYFMTEIIRNKTGLENDGSNLIGQAFGGENPKIQLNKLQTESEKNIQKGIQEILRGLYSAIRNPRSHDKTIDLKPDADSIIIFINYLINIIEKSKLSFEESSFLKRVFDKHYVNNKEYSALLVKDIPKRQKVDIAIRIILERDQGDRTSLSFFLDSLLSTLEHAEIKQIYSVVSNELMYEVNPSQIISILGILPGQYWKQIDKSVRLRIENILLNDASSGKLNIETNKCKSGMMATWISKSHLQEFEDIQKWANLLVKKLKSGDNEEIAYANAWLWDNILDLTSENIGFSLESFIRAGLKNNDNDVIKKVSAIITYDKNHPWWKKFEDELKEHKEIKYIDFDFPF